MTGILTFYWADDYGGMLQAYALKRRLEMLGSATEMIPYAPFKLTGRYWLCPLLAKPAKSGVSYFPFRYIFKQNLLWGRHFWRKRRQMRRFRRKYLTAHLPVRSAKKLSLLKYQTVFVGSDQVWNPDITVDLDDAYVGNIPHRGTCRLVSYGASLGGHRFSEANQQKFVQCARNFSAVTLREQTDAAYAARLLNQEVHDVLDPVLLLDRAEWAQVALRPAESGYILICLTEYQEPLLRCAQALSARLGKKIVSLSRLNAPESSVDFTRDVEMRNDGGPAEFLGYIQNAACVLTNSFHGTAFSILLEKPFLTFRHSTRNVRLADLLQKLGLLSHLTETIQPDEAMEIWTQTDWTAVNAQLAEEREKSDRFILENL